MSDAPLSDGIRLEAASRLDEGLLVLLLAVAGAETSPTEWSLYAEQGGHRVAVSGRWYRCEGDHSGATAGRWVVAIDPRVAMAQPVLVLDDGVTSHRQTVPEIAARIGPAEHFATVCGQSLDPEGRIGLVGFLAAAMGHADASESPRLGQRLHAIREVLRPSLPGSKVAPGVEPSMRLERVVGIDARCFWLTGWIHGANPYEATLVATSPEGTRATIDRKAVSFELRPGVRQSFGDDGITVLGFRALVELDQPSRHPTGWVLELRTPSGAAIQDVARKPVVDRLQEARRLVTAPRVQPVDSLVLSRQLLPAVTRLAEHPDSGTIKQITDYGSPPQEPEASVVIVAQAIDRIEHQVIEFARDPAIANTELIFVVAAEVDDRELVSLAGDLAELHRLSFRLMLVSPTANLQRAWNLGASVAVGPVVALLSGDVLATSPGWLRAAGALIAQRPEVGVVGPLLLYEDGSVASAGSSFVRRQGSDLWRRESPLHGLSPQLPSARQQRRVDAISGACMILATEQLRALGGLCELYLPGGEYAGELSLALAQAELQTWYLPEAQLHLLERERPAERPDPTVETFNDWLFALRWSGELERRERDRPGAGGAPSSPSPRPLARRRAGRRPAPIRAVEIEHVPADGARLTDSDLRTARAGDEGSPYDGTFSLALEGWALPVDGQPLTIECSSDGSPARRVTAALPSPDAVGRHPDVPAAQRCGFALAIGSLPLALEFELTLDAVHADGTRAPIATVRGARRPLKPRYQPELQPIAINTLGRSGSIWLLTLLSGHPAIVVPGQFRYEPALISYWIGLLQLVAEPGSYMQAITPDLLPGDDAWLGADRHRPAPPRLVSNQLPRWLGGENIEEVAAFCHGRIDAAYRRVASDQKRRNARYFAEKVRPGPLLRTLGELYPGQRELILIRDPRDWICSITDYNAKRGITGWRADQAASDEQWFELLRADMATLVARWHSRRAEAHLVRYEDLVQRPEQTLGEIFAYLDLNAAPGLIARSLHNASQTFPQGQTFHRTSPDAAASIGRFKRDMPPEQQALCAEMFGDVLREFGYEEAAGVSADATA